MNILLCILILLWLCILVWTNPFLLFYFPECLRGWLDYLGHSVLFSRTLRGVPRVLRRSITPLLLWTPDCHFFSRPLRGVPRVLRRSITPLPLWTLNWHLFSRPPVASFGFS